MVSYLLSLVTDTDVGDTVSPIKDIPELTNFYGTDFSSKITPKLKQIKSTDYY